MILKDSATEYYLSYCMEDAVRFRRVFDAADHDAGGSLDVREVEDVLTEWEMRDLQEEEVLAVFR